MGDAIDAAHLERQRTWSRETFGPGHRTKGVLDHIRKELKEIEADPLDVKEWVDVIILAFDGAWRAGWEPQQIIDAIEAKQARNEARSWPDWRIQSEDQAIEHVWDEPDPARVAADQAAQLPGKRAQEKAWAEHRMVPGSHERVYGPVCVCGRDWLYYDGRCASGEQEGA